ncbi:MAG: hypothetical protein H5T50_04995 [Nitrososphaeria archaeon]|nr:hypothetical protein [Nitrososphaeria archaeon]
MVRESVHFWMDKDILDRMREEAFRRYGKLKGLGLVMEEACRMYLASRPATCTISISLHKRTRDKVDFLIQFLKDPEKAQTQYKRDELLRLIGALLQVEDERTKIKYLKSLVALKVLDFHQYNPEIVINKVYPFQQTVTLREESKSKSD